jgi:universal stress protein E
MQRFKNILLVLNPEIEWPATLHKAISLVRRNEARLTLFSVLNEPPGIQSNSQSAAQHLLASAAAERREWLRGLMKPLHEEDLDVVIRVVVGIPFLEIIRQVLREQHDLVITTAEEKKKGIRARLFGTTSMHLMRKCPCPLCVVKPAQTRPYARVLAAVAPAAHDPKRDSLNSLILHLAGSMARREAAELHIVRVWRLFSERYVLSHSMTEEELKKLKTPEEMQHKQRLDSLLGRVDVADLKPHLHLIEGNPDERIPELVEAQGIDLLVMGTLSRTGIAGFLIGNTAEEVLNQVDCSVLTLKPEGFVTPVTLE